MLVAFLAVSCGGDAGQTDVQASPATVVATPAEAPAAAGGAGDSGAAHPAGGEEGAASVAPAAETGDLLDAPAATPEAITTYGVPQCDNYVKKYLQCIETRVPADQRQGWIATFEANQAKWKGLASMREGKLALGLACKSALEMSRQALAVDFGCEF